MMKKNRSFGSNLYLGLVMLFLYLPIVVMIVFSFNESKSRANFTGFTFKWYTELFENELIMSSFWNTVIIAILASVIATILGTLAAIGISNMKKLTRKTVMNATYLPIISPEIVTGVSLCLLFVFLAGLIGLQFGFTTVLIAHITFSLPYVILNVLPKLRQMDKNIYEAALDLGCSPFRAYRKVVLPEILPGIFAGFIMAFTYSLDDFIITYFVSGSGFQTLPVTIYGMVRKKVNPQINALSTILFVVVLVLLILMNLKKNKKAEKTEKKTLVKRIVALAAVPCIFLSFFAFAGLGKNNEATTLYIYNWGEYMPDGSDDSRDIIKEFEEAYPHIDVVYDTFTSNEALYSKLKSGGSNYDLIVPSDYMVARLIEEDMIQKIDFDNIPNAENIMDSFRGQNYDPTDEYSVPYSWGTVGVIYNTTMVSGTPDSWDILWDEQYSNNILMFNNSRDAFGIVQKFLGYSQNTTDVTELKACAEKLKEQKPLVQAYVMDEIFDKMESGEAAAAPYYAGDAITMMEECEDLAYFLPKEGSNKFVDAMCIPTGAKNKEAAELFIDFVLEGDVGAEICNFIGYSTPNQAAYDLLDEEVKNNEIAYPPEDILAKCEFYQHLPKDVNQMMQDLWVEIKTE